MSLQSPSPPPQKFKSSFQRIVDPKPKEVHEVIQYDFTDEETEARGAKRFAQDSDGLPGFPPTPPPYYAVCF